MNRSIQRPRPAQLRENLISSLGIGQGTSPISCEQRALLATSGDDLLCWPLFFSVGVGRQKLCSAPQTGAIGALPVPQIEAQRLAQTRQIEERRFGARALTRSKRRFRHPAAWHPR